MGDTGDVSIGKQPASVIFTYETLGRGPHEWDYTYIGKQLNPKPAFFAGVLLLDPPNCWGTLLNCGYDLRGFKKLRWEARSLGEDVFVEFIIGGVVWQWDSTTKTQVAVPYPESLPRISLGVKLLTSHTQSFEYDISYLPEEALRKVIGGFGWVITWDANGVKRDASGTGPVEAKTFVIEVSKIEYLK